MGRTRGPSPRGRLSDHNPARRDAYLVGSAIPVRCTASGIEKRTARAISGSAATRADQHQNRPARPRAATPARAGPPVRSPPRGPQLVRRHRRRARGPGAPVRGSAPTTRRRAAPQCPPGRAGSRPNRRGPPFHQSHGATSGRGGDEHLPSNRIGTPAGAPRRSPASRPVRDGRAVAADLQEAVRVRGDGEVAEVVDPGRRRLAASGSSTSRSSITWSRLVRSSAIRYAAPRRPARPQQLLRGAPDRDDGERLIRLQVVRHHRGHVGDHRVRGVEAVLDGHLPLRRRAPQVLAPGGSRSLGERAADPLDQPPGASGNW